MTPDQLAPGVSVADVAASFQAAVVDVLVQKTIRAATERGATEIWIAGGVAPTSRCARRWRREPDPGALSAAAPVRR